MRAVNRTVVFQTLRPSRAKDELYVSKGVGIDKFCSVWTVKNYLSENKISNVSLQCRNISIDGAKACQYREVF